MSGWRARIGIISPLGEPIERAFNLYSPEGVSINSTKVHFDGPTIESLIALGDQVEEAAKLFVGPRHDVIIFGCTSGSMVKGLGYDKECIEKITRASGVPGLTTSTAVLEAFAAFGNPSCAVITPYPDETNAMEKKFLEDNGIKVTNIQGIPEARKLNPKGKATVADWEPSFLYRRAKELELMGAECLFISCTGLNTMEIINMLETDIGLPVITSIQASLWSALRHAGVGEKDPRFGRLFSM